MFWPANAATKRSTILLIAAVAAAVLLAAILVWPLLQRNLLFVQIAAQMAGTPGECAGQLAGGAALDVRSRGLAAYACGEYGKAAALLAEDETGLPAAVLNSYFEVESLLKAGDYAAAVEELKDAETRSLFETRGLDQQAVSDLTLVVDAGSTDPRIYYTLGRLSSQENPEQAGDFYARGLQLDSERNTAPAQLALAFVARRDQEWQAMAAAYGSAVEYADGPNLKCEILNEAASMTMFEAADGEQALVWAAQLRDLCPWLLDGWIHLIYFNSYLGRSDEALQWYDMAQQTRFAGLSVLEDARNYVLANQ